MISIIYPPTHLKCQIDVLRDKTGLDVAPKGMSKIYLKITIETFSKLRFSGFKKFVTRSVFEQLQLTQISFNLNLLIAT